MKAAITLGFSCPWSWTLSGISRRTALLQWMFRRHWRPAHRIAMPQEALATLLKRAAQKHYLVREYGRFNRKGTKPLPVSNVAELKGKITEEQAQLGSAFQAHAAKRGLSVESANLALEMLFEFLERQQVSILLGDPLPVEEGADYKHRQSAIIAEFIQNVIRSDDAMIGPLRGVLEGLVLYHAAFLPNLVEAKRRFRNLRVVFDSVLVRQALGYEGPAMQALMRETLDLLKGSGVHCIVFDKTIHEIQRILAMYEQKLATAEGRHSLRGVAMARHFLAQRYTPGDVREMSALLQREILGADFYIQEAPARRREFTAAEEALAKCLADPIKKDEAEPRVLHDVDCVAGVLTMREGHRSSSLEEVRVVFATSSSLVIRNTRLWWDACEHETGLPPIIHIRALSSLAWLKKPIKCADFKIHELAALCTAALRPSSKTWRRFLSHLDAMKKSKVLTSDEEAAIVVSAMSDNLLLEAELADGEDEDIDACNLDEIVDRVKASYGAKADEEVRRVSQEYERKLSESEKQREAEKLHAESAERSVAELLRRSEMWIEGRARTRARVLARHGSLVSCGDSAYGCSCTAARTSFPPWVGRHRHRHCCHCICGSRVFRSLTAC